MPVCEAAPAHYQPQRYSTSRHLSTSSFILHLYERTENLGAIKAGIICNHDFVLLLWFYVGLLNAINAIKHLNESLLLKISFDFVNCQNLMEIL